MKKNENNKRKDINENRENTKKQDKSKNRTK